MQFRTSRQAHPTADARPLTTKILPDLYRDTAVRTAARVRGNCCVCISRGRARWTTSSGPSNSPEASPKWARRLCRRLGLGLCCRAGSPLIPVAYQHCQQFPPSRAPLSRRTSLRPRYVCWNPKGKPAKASPSPLAASLLFAPKRKRDDIGLTRSVTDYAQGTIGTFFSPMLLLFKLTPGPGGTRRLLLFASN